MAQMAQMMVMDIPWQELYKQEGITCDFSDFPDNQVVVFGGMNCWSLPGFAEDDGRFSLIFLYMIYI